MRKTKLFIFTNLADSTFCADSNLFAMCLSSTDMIFGTCFKPKNTYFKFTSICCHIPHEYVSLVFIVDAVVSHLYMANGCKVKTLMTKYRASFPTSLPYFLRGSWKQTTYFSWPN